ncbi:MAG TPA: hypothetical protein PKE37_15180 [Thiomonas arsenitoxydans]|nr:hypothetical protein [Thiomonas arsenitoxydans]HML83099.1 hypothetical protein [Thiomonas arsenitoxydans]
MKAILTALLLATLAGCASEAPPSWKGQPFHPINPPAASASMSSTSGVTP